MNKLETLSYIISHQNKITILETLKKYKQQTRYDLFKTIPISYKNTHRHFKKLEELNCIKKVDIDHYNKRGAIYYELTEKGEGMLKIIKLVESLSD